jgi:hypothetical protein
MNGQEITRSQFLRDSSRLAAGAMIGSVVPPCAAQTPKAESPLPIVACRSATERCAAPLTLRPYQTLCLFCALGQSDSGPQQGRLHEVLDAIRHDPDRPITLQCNAGDVYVYQDPGTGEDTAESSEFNRKRDLDILQRMNWPPGTTLPARALLMSIHRQITSVAGICGYAAVTAEAWKGCPKAQSGNYEKGRQKGIGALIPPRSDEEMAQEKEKSLSVLATAQSVTIRPHILLCAVCQYGSGTRPPYKADNLPELLDLILHKNPDLPITMARGADWMMCAPCPHRTSRLNACVNVLGSGGLSNEKRDLDMLQKLGLHFGSTMKARDLYRLIFERIPTTQDICRRDDNRCPSVWWDPCGEANVKQGNSNYEKGRAELMAKLK